MSDNKENTDKRDRTQVNMNEPYEVQYWSDKFNITPDELRSVVDRAGSEEVKEIERTLNYSHMNDNNYGK
ncbi:MAG: DUF3606 domain-containing protein [Flavobacterium sp.]|nr:MAG: DUF3606 domain-containing protein [Flavobacterium sp.]